MRADAERAHVAERHRRAGRGGHSCVPINILDAVPSWRLCAQHSARRERPFARPSVSPRVRPVPLQRQPRLPPSLAWPSPRFRRHGQTASHVRPHARSRQRRARRVGPGVPLRLSSVARRSIVCGCPKLFEHGFLCGGGVALAINQIISVSEAAHSISNFSYPSKGICWTITIALGTASSSLYPRRPRPSPTTRPRCRFLSRERRIEQPPAALADPRPRPS